MIKLCIVSECMYCGGVEKSLLALLNVLDRDRYSIKLLLIQKKGVLYDMLPEDIAIVEIPLPSNDREEITLGSRKALKNSLHRHEYWNVLKKMGQEVKIGLNAKSNEQKRCMHFETLVKKMPDYPEEFDVVIDYMGYGLFNTFYAAYKIQSKKKLSWIHFDPELGMEDITAFEGVFHKYNSLVCVSKEIQEKMRNKFPQCRDKLQLFYNIVDDVYLSKMASESVVYDENYDGKKILSIGRVDPPKGYDIAIYAIKKLVLEGYHIRWYIIGDGPQWQLMEQLIQENNLEKHVKLLGCKTNPYPYLQRCDYYFQPSRHEGYGIALAEARAFDKPIVTTDFAGAKEQLVHGKTGIITKCTENDLYRSLKNLLDDDELRQRLSHNLSLDHGMKLDYNTILETIIEKS